MFPYLVLIAGCRRVGSHDKLAADSGREVDVLAHGQPEDVVGRRQGKTKSAKKKLTPLTTRPSDWKHKPGRQANLLVSWLMIFLSMSLREYFLVGSSSVMGPFFLLPEDLSK